jgi:quercetin dioxygenase-like cupin family protein
MTGLETIESNGAAVAYIIRGDANPLATTFVTPHDAAMQVGLVTHAAGHTITRHRHPARASHQGPMVEVLVVRRGRCEVQLYNDSGEPVATRELLGGDSIVMIGGGHGFRMLEDTVLFEVKQGPFPGPRDKESF